MTATSSYLNRPLRTEHEARMDRAIADNAAGNWPVSRCPHDEIERQQAIYTAAKNILDAAEAELTKLAHLSQDHRSIVNADQDDWPLTIGDVFADLANDTFNLMPEALDRARQRIREGQ